MPIKRDNAVLRKTFVDGLRILHPNMEQEIVEEAATGLMCALRETDGVRENEVRALLYTALMDRVERGEDPAPEELAEVARMGVKVGVAALLCGVRGGIQSLKAV